MSSHRYLRLVVTARSSDAGDTYAHLALLEITPTPTSSLTATSPDTIHLTNVASHAVDGDLSTWWQPVTATVNPTLVVDRGAAALWLTSIRCQWHSAGFQAVDYTFATSPDNATWTTVVTVTGNVSTDRTDTVAPPRDLTHRLGVIDTKWLVEAPEVGWRAGPPETARRR